MSEELTPEQMKLIALGELAGGIVHEISSPLQVLSGYLNQLDSKLSDEFRNDNAQMLSTMKNTLDIMEKLVSSILNIKKILDPNTSITLNMLTLSSMIIIMTSMMVVASKSMIFTHFFYMNLVTYLV